MQRRKIRIGIIGLGLMGREFACSIARWYHLLDDGDTPVLTGICDKNKDTWEFTPYMFLFTWNESQLAYMPIFRKWFETSV